jgi:thiol-disulfide isomerase/thioredoxin
MTTRTLSRRQQRKYKKSRSPLVGVAIGLVLISAALLLWPRQPQQSTASASAGLSVVPAEVDFAAPELSLTSTDGKSESLADYRDKVVLVNNWAIWCPPCKAEMPTLQAYYAEHADQGLMIVAVEAGDGRDDVVKFAENYGLQFRVWIDPGNASLRAFKNSNLPNSYVIDRTGRVRYAWTGEISRDMLEKYVTPLLAE